MKKFLRGPGAYLILFLLIYVLASSLGSPALQSESVTYAEFLSMMEKGEISQVCVTEQDIVALKSGSTIQAEEFPSKYDYSTYSPGEEAFYQDYRAIIDANPELEAKLKVEFRPVEEPSWLMASLPYLLISLAMLGLFWYIMSQQTGGNGKVMSFGKSKAKLSMGEKHDKTFADVAGANEEKDELKEIVDS